MAIYRINSAIAGMYENPSAEGSLISQAQYAAPVRVIEVKTDWNKIQTPDGYEGWVEGRHITECPHYRSDVKVSSLRAHIYPGEDTCFRPLLTLGFGDPLQLAEKDDGNRWVKVTLISGKTGYVQRGDILHQTATSVVELANQFLGNIPFYWGGTSTIKGMDCSGFVQFVYRQFGVGLPRDSKDQYAALSETVAIDELKQGDLLFFSSMGKGVVNHVAIYAGKGKIIHSTVWDYRSAPGVKVSDLEEFRTARDLIGSKRVLTASDESFGTLSSDETL